MRQTMWFWQKALDKAAKEIGVDFIGGFSALVQKRVIKREMRFLSILFLVLWLKRIRSARQSI